MGEVVVMVAADAQGLGQEGGQGAREEGGGCTRTCTRANSTLSRGGRVLSTALGRVRSAKQAGPPRRLHMRTPMRLCAG